MRVRCFASLDELAIYADVWDRLALGVPFRGWTWLSYWWRHYGPKNDAEAQAAQLATLCVFDEDELIGIAPWYLESSALRGKVLRQLGSGEVCTDYLSILCEPDRENVVVNSLADFLVDNALKAR